MYGSVCVCKYIIMTVEPQLGRTRPILERETRCPSTKDMTVKEKNMNLTKEEKKD